MAYEDMTYEVILARMMKQVSDKYPYLDTREGSILFNALAPAAVELAIAYTEIDNAIKESFVKTASRHYILLACEEMGIDISMFNATAGIHKCVFDTEVSIGSRWNCDLFNYKILEYLGTEDELYVYSAVCETEGTAPNNQSGSLAAIDELPKNLTYAQLVQCLVSGKNETSDENIRTYYYDYVNNLASDGNVAQYKLWCSECDYIGNYKIIPLWNGANTVKVSILNPQNRAASFSVINKFQEYLDPGIEGMGNGVAPIGAFVTVSTAMEKGISITAKAKFKDGYTGADIESHLVKYFSDLAYKTTRVSYMGVGAAILSAEGIDFISDLKINGGTEDIILGEEEIPYLDGISFMEV